jgi:hypothetical protein
MYLACKYSVNLFTFISFPLKNFTLSSSFRRKPESSISWSFLDSGLRRNDDEWVHRIFTLALCKLLIKITIPIRVCLLLLSFMARLHNNQSA